MRALYLKILSSLLVLILPGALFAADRPAAMLYSHGTALLNGHSIARSSAIFFGDQVQTNADSAANINASGSIVLVLNDSLVEYQAYRPRNCWRLAPAALPSRRPPVCGPNLKLETWMVGSSSRREKVTSR